MLLVSRIYTLVNQPRVVLAPRVAQFMHDRMLAQHIEDYAQRYGRPAFYLDSVIAHLDSGDAKIVSGLRTDLWGDPVHYRWTWCDFTLSSSAGRANQPGGFRYSIREKYPWPSGVGRTENCFSGS